MPNGFFSKLGEIAKTTGEGFFPAAQEGLFSGAELRSQRGRGPMRFGTALLAGADPGEAISAAEDGYQKAQMSLLQQKKMQKEQALQAARAAIGQKYAAKPDDTPASLAAKYPAMMQEYLQVGDLEAAAKLEPMVTKIMGDKPTKWQTVQLGDRVVFVNPETREVIDGPERHMMPEELELRRLALQERRVGLQVAQSARDQAVGMAAANAFHRQNRLLLHTEQKWSNWKASYDEAKLGNPQAYKSAIINFVSLADPGTQIRLGMLQFASQLDPSIKGSMELWLKKAEKGEFPPHMLEGMMRHAAGIHANTVEDYKKKYEHRIKVNPKLEGYLEPPEIAFPNSYMLPEQVREEHAMRSHQATTGETPRVQKFMKGKQTVPVPNPRAQQRFDWTSK